MGEHENFIIKLLRKLGLIIKTMTKSKIKKKCVGWLLILECVKKYEEF